MIHHMGGAKEYKKDFERMMGELETKDSRLREQSARSLMAWIEVDRKTVGMKPKEMYTIFESRGIEEVVAEITRRLKAIDSATHI